MRCLDNNTFLFFAGKELVFAGCRELNFALFGAKDGPQQIFVKQPLTGGMVCQKLPCIKASIRLETSRNALRYVIDATT